MKRVVVMLFCFSILASGFNIYSGIHRWGDKPTLNEPPLMQASVDTRVASLDKFFETYKCPLKPYASDFIKAAKQNKIDWRLLTAISFHESTCGKAYPLKTNNPFGFGCEKPNPCYIAKNGSNLQIFNSIPDAISHISQQLSTGNYYANKTISEKLFIYNHKLSYVKETISYMNLISN